VQVLRYVHVLVDCAVAKADFEYLRPRIVSDVGNVVRVPKNRITDDAITVPAHLLRAVRSLSVKEALKRFRLAPKLFAGRPAAAVAQEPAILALIVD
jgi:hypothetical protein